MPKEYVSIIAASSAFWPPQRRIDLPVYGMAHALQHRGPRESALALLWSPTYEAQFRVHRGMGLSQIFDGGSASRPGWKAHIEIDHTRFPRPLVQATSATATVDR